nr:hypothetical protein [Candidatus Omnitrophota bacterium]
MKIGQKLILIFLLISALVWIFGFISVNLSRKSLERYIGESYVSLAVEVLDKIDRHIYSRIEEFQSYCSDKLLQEGISASNQEFEKLEDIEGYITKQDNEWVSAPRELLTPFMLQLINNSMSFELKEKLEFYKKKYSYEIYGEIFATNKYGANVFQTRKTSDYRQNDEKWWQEALV